MFKAGWEKANEQHQLPPSTLEKMVSLAYPNTKLIFYKLIAGGCANLNFKIQLVGHAIPLIIRIYLRDQEAAYREQKLAKLLNKTVPAPLTHYIGDYENYRFAVTEFIEGITLRDLLLEDITYDLSTIMYAVGSNLAKITSHQFPTAGFFDKDLNIIKHLSGNSYLNFAKECLLNKIVLSQLTSETISVISNHLEEYGHLFANENESHLVHADFDPANILVKKVNGIWNITGILDWEFAFSGSVLCDVANMLRYAHKMPFIFEDAFINGLKDSGVSLPKNWRISVHMLNLLSLLDCLKRSDPKNCPNQCNDIRELIHHIISQLTDVKKQYSE